MFRNHFVYLHCDMKFAWHCLSYDDQRATDRVTTAIFSALYDQRSSWSSEKLLSVRPLWGASWRHEGNHRFRHYRRNWYQPRLRQISLPLIQYYPRPCGTLIYHSLWAHSIKLLSVRVETAIPTDACYCNCHLLLPHSFSVITYC